MACTCIMKALECRTLTAQSSLLAYRLPGFGWGGGGKVSPTACMYASAVHNTHKGAGVHVSYTHVTSYG